MERLRWLLQIVGFVVCLIVAIECALSITTAGSITLAEDATSSSSGCATTLSAVDSTSSVSLIYGISTASTSGTLSYFTINGTDVLSCLNSPAGFDYYTQPLYTITVTGCCNSLWESATTTFTVTITEKSKGPYWNTTLMTASMLENATVGTSLYTLSSACYARPSSSHSLSFAFNSTTEPYFTIASGVLSLKSLYSLDYPSSLPTNYNVYVLCTDTTYLTTATGTVAITISDTNTFTPVFNFTNPFFTLSSTEKDQFVGITPAYDYDRSSPNNVISYSVASDSVSSLFKYPTATTGYLTTAQLLSSVTNGTNLTVIIKATDQGSPARSTTTTITISYYAGTTTTTTSTTSSTTSTSTTTTGVTTTTFVTSPSGIATIVVCCVVGVAAIGVGLYFVNRQSQVSPTRQQLRQMGAEKARQPQPAPQNRTVVRPPPYYKPPPRVPANPGGKVVFF